MTGKYATEHASAYAAVASAGSDAVFVKTNPSLAQSTNIVTEGAKTQVPGVAIEIAGNLAKYTQLGLTILRAITLFWVPVTYGDRPTLGSTVVWSDGLTYTVRWVEALAPDGKLITATVVCSV